MMLRAHSRMDEPCPSSARRRNGGFSLVEAVVAVALMGVLVVGTLVLLRTSVRAGAMHRDHANAHAWLQSASDRIYAIDKVPCDPLAGDGGELAVRSAYELEVGLVPNPDGWTSGQIRIVPPVDFWNAADVNGDQITEYSFGPACHDGDGLSLQRIEIEVVSEFGTVIESVEIVK